MGKALLIFYVTYFILFSSFLLKDMFEKVNSAYEFLCSKSRLKEGPDPQNIVLILKAQSILFGRHKEGKYTVHCNLSKSNLRPFNKGQLPGTSNGNSLPPNFKEGCIRYS